MLTIGALAALGTISLLVLLTFAGASLSNLPELRLTENLLGPLILLILVMFMLGLHVFLIWDKLKQQSAAVSTRLKSSLLIYTRLRHRQHGGVRSELRFPSETSVVRVIVSAGKSRR